MYTSQEKRAMDFFHSPFRFFVNVFCHVESYLPKKLIIPSMNNIKPQTKSKIAIRRFFVQLFVHSIIQRTAKEISHKLCAYFQLSIKSIIAKTIVGIAKIIYKIRGKFSFVNFSFLWLFISLALPFGELISRLASL